MNSVKNPNCFEKNAIFDKLEFVLETFTKENRKSGIE